MPDDLLARSAGRRSRSTSATPRQLTREWTYHVLAAVQVAVAEEGHGITAAADLADAPVLATAYAKPAPVDLT